MGWWTRVEPGGYRLVVAAGVVAVPAGAGAGVLVGAVLGVADTGPVGVGGSGADGDFSLPSSASWPCRM